MSVTTDTPIVVDSDGVAIEVLAVKFGESPFVERIPSGDLIAYREAWDEQSVVTPTTRVRLLTYHDRSRPVGWLDRFWTERDGLHASGTLVGGASKLDELRALVASGLAADVSVGFVPDPEQDEWRAPQQRNGLAAVRRRGARLREVSVVDLAGIPGSRVLQIRTPRPGPSAATLTALDDAERVIKSGPVHRQRIDEQATVALLLAEADQLVAAGQRWAHVEHDEHDAHEAEPTAPAAAPMTYRQLLLAEEQAAEQRLLEENARHEYAELIERRRHAENNAARRARQLDEFWRTRQH